MTIQEVLRVRALWKELWVNPNCGHPVIGPVRDSHGILTGLYVCTRCGAEILGDHTATAVTTRQAVTP